MFYSCVDFTDWCSGNSIVQRGCVQTVQGLNEVRVNVSCVKAFLKHCPAASGREILTVGKGGVTQLQEWEVVGGLIGACRHRASF